MALLPIERIKNFDSYKIQQATNWDPGIIEEFQNIIDVLIDSASMEYVADQIANVLRRNDILGTVAQVGGQPTGDLFEIGTNANGTFIRIPTGTQICYGTITVLSLGNNIPYGALWYSGLDRIAFPASFISMPQCFISGYHEAFQRVPIFGIYNTTTTFANYYTFDVTQQPASNVIIYFLATGRWF